MTKKIEDTFQFEEKIHIEYTPENFYDKLVELQRKYQCEKSLNYVDNRFLSQLEKDNIDFINDYEQIIKFRQYYTDHLVYNFCARNKKSLQMHGSETISKKWFRPYKIIKNEFKDANQKFAKVFHDGISSHLQNIQKTDTLISDILSYSTIPGLFSYFLTDGENDTYIGELDSLITRLMTEPQKHIYYDHIKIFVKGVFRMPTFINFLRKIMYSLFIPYLCNEKPFHKKEIPNIYSAILKKAQQYRSYCPLIVKDIIDKLRQKDNHDDISFNGQKLCVSIFKDCLFNSLQQEPASFMCSDFPSYEINHDFLLEKKNSESIIKNRIYRHFFDVLFEDNNEFTDFVFDFICCITKKAEANDISRSRMKLTMKYIYLYQFDIDLIKSEKDNYTSVITNFNDCVEKGVFNLLSCDNLNIPKVKSSVSLDSPKINKNLEFEDILLEMIESAPILLPKSKIQKTKILDIINEYLINYNEPLLLGRDIYRYNLLRTMWEKVYEKFPKNLDELNEYFDKITKSMVEHNKSHVEAIKQHLKEKGEFGLKLFLSKKTIRNWNSFTNNMIIKNLVNSILKSKKLEINTFFPRTHLIVEDPDKYFKSQLELITKWIYIYNEKKLKCHFDLNSFTDFQIYLSGFFLNCNLKYYNYIFFKSNLGEIDLQLHNFIYAHVGEIIVNSNKSTIPDLYLNTFGSSITYYTEDVINLRTAFDANVDAHKKIALVQHSIDHAINKLENQFFLTSKSKDRDVDHQLFIDLLIAFANPQNLFSNLVFMIEYEIHNNYYESISRYFVHFLNILNSEKEIFGEEKKVGDFKPRNYLVKKNKEIEPNLNMKDKKILFIVEGEMNLTLLLSEIIPNKFNWDELKAGNDVSFNVKQKKDYTRCIFSVDDNEKPSDLNNFDVLILYFDSMKNPKRLKEISALAKQNKKVTKIAICNNVKKIKIKDYCKVFDHVFEFSKCPDPSTHYKLSKIES